MNILNALNTLALVICVSGCGQAPSGGSVDIASANPNESAPISQPVSNPTSTPSSSPSPTSSPIALTYYSRSTTIAPVAGHSLDTVTLTGSCIVYTGNTYCWDNGVQEIDETVSHLTTQYYYTYFSMGRQTPTGLLGICWGGCPVDAMSVPTVIDMALGNDITTSYTTDHYAQNTVATVLTGIATQVTCTEDNGLLDCGDFTIDLNQVGL